MGKWSEVVKTVDKVDCFIFHLLHAGLTAESVPMRARVGRRTIGGDE
jgi:hypothetical protein